MNDDKSKKVALRVQIGDHVQDITFDELTLSNNLGLEALVKVLVDKNIFKPEELQKEIDRIRKDRYRDHLEKK